MGGEAVGLDVDRARALAAACGQVGRVAGLLAREVDLLLGRGHQSDKAGRLLAEVDEELRSLAGVIEAAADQAEIADRWTVLAWLAGTDARLVAGFSQQGLWRSLNDSVGARALDVGVFDLADSFRRMDTVDWQLAVATRGCRSFGDGRYYSGGGAIRGPDGRLYAVVVPHLVTDGDHFTIDADISAGTAPVASLAGGDRGWTMIGYRTGVERIMEEPSGWWRAITGLAVATGLGVSPGVDDGYLSGVHLRAGTQARFSTTITAPAPVEPIGGGALTGLEPMMWLVIDGRPGWYPIADVPDLVPDRRLRDTVPRSRDTFLGRANTGDNLLALVTGAMTGYVAARDLDHGSYRAYEVIFEENTDGRRRSRVQSFTLEGGPAGVALYGWHLFLDADGDLRQSPVSYRSSTEVSPDDVVLAHNPFDPDFAQRVGRASFGG
jgi:hypothetical protein